MCNDQNPSAIDHEESSAVQISGTIDQGELDEIKELTGANGNWPAVLAAARKGAMFLRKSQEIALRNISTDGEVEGK